MPQRRTTIRPIGLVTEPSPWQTPPEALSVANDIVIRRPGVIEPRPGWDRDTTAPEPTTYTEPYTKLIEFAPGSTLGFDANGVAAWVETGDNAWFGFAVTEAVTSVGYCIQMRQSVYPLDIDEPPKKIAEADEPDIRWAGFNPARQGRVELTDTGTTETRWLPTNEYVAYRVVYRSEDANGYIRRSPPSGIMLVQNDLPLGDDTFSTLTLPLMGLDTNLEVEVGDVVEVYRTPNSTTDAVSPEYQLVTEQTITAADLGGLDSEIVIIDQVPEEQLGAALYTNPGQQGEAAAKFPPPPSQVGGVFGGTAIYANVQEPVFADIKPQDLLVWSERSTSNGFGVTVTAAAGNPVLTVTGGSGLDVPIGYGVWAPGNDPVSAGLLGEGRYVIATTAGTITMNANAANGGAGIVLEGGPRIAFTGDGGATLHELYGFTSTIDYNLNNRGTWDDTIPPTIVAQGVLPNRAWNSANEMAYMLNKAADGVTLVTDTGERQLKWLYTQPTRALTGGGYDPVLELAVGGPLLTGHDYGDGVSTTGGGENRNFQPKPNVFYWSETNEPEAVPVENRAFVGREDKAIEAFASTDDFALFFKEDGIYELTGQAGIWRVQLRYPDVRVVAPTAVDVLAGAVYAWTNRGVVMVTQGDIKYLSRDLIQDQLEDLQRTILADTGSLRGVWLRAYPNEHEIWIGTPNINFINDPEADVSFVWNAKTQSWVKHLFGHARPTYFDGAQQMRAGKIQGANARLIASEQNGPNGPYHSDAQLAININTVTAGVSYTIDAGPYLPRIGDRIFQGSGDTDVIVEVFSPTVFETQQQQLGNDVFTTGGATAWEAVRARWTYRFRDGGDPTYMHHWLEARAEWLDLRSTAIYQVDVLGRDDPFDSATPDTLTQELSGAIQADGRPLPITQWIPRNQCLGSTLELSYFAPFASTASPFPDATTNESWAFNGVQITFEPTVAPERRRYRP